MSNPDNEKRLAGYAAADYVADGMAVGLGTGSTVAYFLEALGKRVQDEGLRLRGVPTSEDTAAKCRAAGIELTDFSQVKSLDVAIDGADEIDARFNMIKGGGGALLREKIVLTAAQKRIIIADSSKRVERLGAFPLPVEVLPFGYEYVAGTIAQTGVTPSLRGGAGSPKLTDNGNYVLDCPYGEIGDPQALNGVLKNIPGVVETGLFLGLLDVLIVGVGDGVETATA